MLTAAVCCVLGLAGAAAQSISGAILQTPVSVVQGGTGLASVQSGGVLCFPSTTTALSSTALAANGVVVGGGAGACPGAITAGINGQLLLGVTSAAPQMATMSGDATISNAGALTLATVNANVGTFGSATQASQVAVNAKGLITAVSNVTATPAIGSITGLGTGIGTALATNVGTAGSVVVNGGALGTPSSGTATSLTGLPISTGLAGAGTGVLAALGNTLNAASGLVGFSGALGTPTSGTLTNATALPLSTGISGLGTGVATQLALPVSTNGGSTTTLASGATAMGTSAIGSATCATAVSPAAIGVLTTDVVNWSFNGDPTAVTGYIPSASGMLAVIAYPTAGNVNFKICNNTSGSITPGAITLNWRVVR